MKTISIYRPQHNGNNINRTYFNIQQMDEKYKPKKRMGKYGIQNKRKKITYTQIIFGFT